MTAYGMKIGAIFVDGTMVAKVIRAETDSIQAALDAGVETAVAAWPDARWHHVQRITHAGSKQRAYLAIADYDTDFCSKFTVNAECAEDALVLAQHQIDHWYHYQAGYQLSVRELGGQR